MAKELRPLGGRVVAITGGARGIGAETAKALVRKGAKVAIGDLDVALAEQTAKEIGGETVAFELDVTSRRSFEDFIAQVEERVGPLDVLVNNAGIMPVSRILDEDDASAQRIIDIDVHGVILGTKLALERMAPRNSGHIVNIASQAGKAGIPGLATYCAAKHAVIGFSEAVRGEFVDTEIEVSCVMPAVVNTELTSGVRDTRGVKRVEPQDVANAIVDALERPHFDVHVPKSAGVIGKVTSILPRAGREAIGKAIGMDTLMLEVDEGARAAYEKRAAESVSAERESEDEETTVSS